MTTNKAGKDRYYLLFRKREPLREDFWWVKAQSNSRVEIEKLYDKYFYEAGMGYADMRITHEI